MEEDTELGHICLPNNTAYTRDYSQSLAFVLIDLITKTASSDGFRYASYSWPPESPNEWAYGMALCRGDVSSDDCTACVNNSAIAVVTAKNNCTYSRVAILWRDYCFLKYSDIDFFGTIDTDNKFSSRNDSSWKSLETSPDAVQNLTANLSQTATQTSKLYAYGTANITDDPADDYVTVYGMAQCTKDISPDDCNYCLERARNRLATIKQGGIILFGSCNMRYETYNFNSSAIN